VINRGETGKERGQRWLREKEGSERDRKKSQLEKREKKKQRNDDEPSLLSSTSSTSDTVKVDVDRAGHLVVDDILDTLDVKSASSPILSISSVRL
jgi:hypothetical protein